MDSSFDIVIRVSIGTIFHNEYVIANADENLGLSLTSLCNDMSLNDFKIISRATRDRIYIGENTLQEIINGEEKDNTEEEIINDKITKTIRLVFVRKIYVESHINGSSGDIQVFGYESLLELIERAGFEGYEKVVMDNEDITARVHEHVIRFPEFKNEKYKIEKKDKCIHFTLA